MEYSVSVGFGVKSPNFAVRSGKNRKLCVVASVMGIKVLLEKLDTFIDKNIYISR